MAPVQLEELLYNTLNLLEWRLKRLEFLLHSDKPEPDSKDDSSASDSEDDDDAPKAQPHEDPVLRRIRHLESALKQLSNRSEVASELLKLHTRHPDLFTPTPTTIDASLTVAQKTASILSSAPAIHTAASQLRALSDTALPAAESFSKLSALQPRVDAAARRQEELQQDVSELRKRSAKAVTQWHEVLVLAQGRQWVEWEGRIAKCEREVSRAAVRRGDDG